MTEPRAIHAAVLAVLEAARALYECAADDPVCFESQARHLSSVYHDIATLEEDGWTLAATRKLLDDGLAVGLAERPDDDGSYWSIDFPSDEDPADEFATGQYIATLYSATAFVLENATGPTLLAAVTEARGEHE